MAIADAKRMIREADLKLLALWVDSLIAGRTMMTNDSSSQYLRCSQQLCVGRLWAFNLRGLSRRRSAGTNFA